MRVGGKKCIARRVAEVPTPVVLKLKDNGQMKGVDMGHAGNYLVTFCDAL